MAAGGVPKVSVALPGFTVTVTGPVLVFAGLLESVAFTVTVVDPLVVGVTVIRQLLLSDKPAGSVPPASTQV